MSSYLFFSPDIIYSLCKTLLKDWFSVYHTVVRSQNSSNTDNMFSPYVFCNKSQLLPDFIGLCMTMSRFMHMINTDNSQCHHGQSASATILLFVILYIKPKFPYQVLVKISSSKTNECSMMSLELTIVPGLWQRLNNCLVMKFEKKLFISIISRLFRFCFLFVIYIGDFSPILWYFFRIILMNDLRRFYHMEYTIIIC